MNRPIEAPSAPRTRAEVLAAVPRAPELGYALYHVLGSYAQLVLALAFVRLRPPGAAWTVLAVALVGLTQYRLYFPLHEACHGTLFRREWANRLVGRLTAALFGTSLETFTLVHMQHHRLYGQVDDPGAEDYFVHFRSRAAAWLFFLAPLLGLRLLAKLPATLGQALLRRVPAAPAGAGKASAPLARWSMGDFVWIAAVQGLLFLVLSDVGAHPLDYALGWLLPGATVFLFLARLRMYLEHGPLDYAVSDYLGANPRRIARTHDVRGLAGVLLSHMNFHYHWEHHQFPSLPSSRLPEVHRRFGAGTAEPDDAAPSYADTLRRLLRLASSGSA